MTLKLFMAAHICWRVFWVFQYIRKIKAFQLLGGLSFQQCATPKRFRNKWIQSTLSLKCL